jgi:hypothetical protein
VCVCVCVPSKETKDTKGTEQAHAADCCGAADV